MSTDQQILASYWHGLMDTPEALDAILTWASGNGDLAKVDYQMLREQSIDCLADSVEQQFNWDKLEQAMAKFEHSKTRYR